jgi:hypothetical protein
MGFIFLPVFFRNALLMFMGECKEQNDTAPSGGENE